MLRCSFTVPAGGGREAGGGRRLPPFRVPGPGSRVPAPPAERPRGEPRGLLCNAAGGLPACAQHRRVATVVLEPGAVVQRLVDEAIATVAARAHQQLGRAVGDVVHLQTDLDVVVDVVEERAVELAEI